MDNKNNDENRESENEIKIENSRRKDRKKLKKNNWWIFISVLMVIAVISGIYFGMHGMNISAMGSVAEKIGSAFGSGTPSADAGISGTEADNAISSSASSASDSTSQNSTTNSSANIFSTSAIKFESDSKSIFVPGNKGFYHFSKDGAKYYDLSGGQKWNVTYTMSNIMAVSKGDYTAVGEIQGRNLKVYNETGEVYSVSADGIILNFSVNEKGWTTVVLKYSEEYRIQVYSAGGEIAFERYEQDSGIYPLSSVLSSDSGILAVSYIDSTSIEMESKIMLFNLNNKNADSSATNDFFAALERKGQIVPLCNYSKNDEFVFVGDKEIFAMSRDGNLSWEMELTNKIEKVAFSPDGKVIAAMGDELSDTESGYDAGTIVFYDLSGKETATVEMGEKVTYLKCFDTQVVAGCGKKFEAVSDTGKVQWQYDATQDISDMIALGGKDLLVVTSSTADITTVKKLIK